MRLKPLLLSMVALSSYASEPKPKTNEFDWSLLEGTWAESTRHQFGCRPDNVHHKFEVGTDRKLLSFKLDRKWKIGTGQEVEQYAASIVSQSPNVLIIKYGMDLANIPEEMREWELRFIGPGTYRWRATAWPLGQYNEVVGVKCNP